MSTIQEFKSYLNKNGLSIKNKYMISLSVPETLRGSLSLKSPEGSFFTGLLNGFLDATLNTNFTSLSENEQTSNFLNLACMNIDVPAVNVSTTPFRKRKFAYSVEHQPITLTFLLSDSMQEKYFFDNWISLINNPTSRRTNYYDSYISEIRIKTLGAKDDRYYIDIQEAVPTSTGSVQLNRNALNEYNTFTVTFEYRKAVSNDAFNERLNTANNIFRIITGDDVPFIGNNNNTSPNTSTAPFTTNSSSLNILNGLSQQFVPGSDERGYVDSASSIVSNNTGNVNISTSNQMLSTLQSDINNNNNISESNKSTLVNGIEQSKSELGRN